MLKKCNFCGNSERVKDFKRKDTMGRFHVARLCLDCNRVICFVPISMYNDISSLEYLPIKRKKEKLPNNCTFEFY